MSTKKQNQTIREYFGEKGVKKIKQRIDEFFDNKSGFILIYTKKENKITDAFKGICGKCILKLIKNTLKEADEIGLLAKHKTCKKLNLEFNTLRIVKSITNFITKKGKNKK